MNRPTKLRGRPVANAAAGSEEKIHKVLARAGHGSRREMETWITAGRVTVNGETAAIGQRVSPADQVRVDGRDVAPQTVRSAVPRVLLYHKPPGEICARRDPEGRPTVFDRLPRLSGGRWVSIGRLDFNTCGLLLFSNAGDLVHKLTHPSSGVEREYAVRVFGEVEKGALANLRDGVDLDGKQARFTRIVPGGGDGINHWYRVVLEEGRNREVRRLWETQGVRVSRLIRVRYGDVELPRDLRPGRWMEMDPESVDALHRMVGLSAPSVEPEEASRPGGAGRDTRFRGKASGRSRPPREPSLGGETDRSKRGAAGKAQTRTKISPGTSKQANEWSSTKPSSGPKNLGGAKRRTPR